MSWKAMLKILDQLPTELSAAERSLFFVLRIRQADNASCFPSQARLSRETGLPERSLRRAMKTLQARQLVRIDRRGDDRRWYAYTVEIPAHLAATQAQDAGQSGQVTGQITQESPANVADRKSIEGFNEGIEPRHVVGFWNDRAATSGLPEAALTPERERALRHLIANTPREEITAAIKAVHRSRFLTGKTERPFKATIEFILKPDNRAKLLECAYD